MNKQQRQFWMSLFIGIVSILFMIIDIIYKLPISLTIDSVILLASTYIVIKNYKHK